MLWVSRDGRYKKSEQGKRARKVEVPAKNENKETEVSIVREKGEADKVKKRKRRGK